VTIRDSKGDPDVAADAVNELVSVEHAAAIVGPVDSAAASAAAEIAETLNVPLLTLSIRENPSEGSFVFRDFVSNKAEVKALVAKAREAGNENFGIFYPENGYGRKMRELYKAELLEFGLEIESEVSYPTNVTQFREQAEKIAAEEIDVLFVPDTAARLALLAPALAAAGLWSARTGDEPQGPGKAVQLLISSTGLAPDLIRRTGRYMDGAYFATYFTPDSSTSAAEFEDNYYREYGGTPDFLAAFAHDCVTLVAWAIKEGSNDRDDIRARLQDASQNAKEAISVVAPFDGFADNGEPLAPPWIEQLLGGELQLVR
jgi:ABC-type branched-subunit amino acid transport system substrate-binding protein